MPRASIIIPVREKNPAFLVKKLQMLHTGEFYDFEIIIVDDCSPVFMKSYVNDFPLVSKVIRLNNPIPYNMGEAKNVGAESARAKWLAFSDVDVVFTDGSLKTLVDRADKVEEKVVMGKLCVPNCGTYIAHPAWTYRICCFCLIDRDAFHSVKGFSTEMAGNYGYDDDFLHYKLIKRFKFKFEGDCLAYMDRLDKGSFDPPDLSVNYRKYQDLKAKFDKGEI